MTGAASDAPEPADQPEFARPLDRLHVAGITFRTCPADLRDRLELDPDGQDAMLRLIAAGGARESLVLSTCDRIEVLAVAEDARALPRVVSEALAARLGTGVREVERMLHHRHGLDAARHLFRVAASLDSQMIGEPQVLGQVKSSHQAARALGTAGRTLEVVLQAAYEAAKRVRSETRIAERPVSIMAAAAHIARDLHGDLAGSGLVLAGTTEMGVALAGHLGGAGMRPAMVLDRNHRRAAETAKALAGHYAEWAGLEDALAAGDIVVSCVGDGRHVLNEALVRRVLRARRRRPMLIVDFAVPSDVEPAVERIDEAFVYTLDDFERIALQGRASREAASREAEAIVEAELARLAARQAERGATPAIGRLREHFEGERLRLLAERPGLDAEAATRLLVNRLLHRPSAALRGLAAADGLDAGAEALLDRLFRAGDPLAGDDHGDAG